MLEARRYIMEKVIRFFQYYTHCLHTSKVKAVLAFALLKCTHHSPIRFLLRYLSRLLTIFAPYSYRLTTKLVLVKQ